MESFKDWLVNEEKDACYHKVMSRYGKWSAYAAGATVKCRKVGAANWGNSTKEETEYQEGTFDLEKKQGLHGWFARNRGKGWIDCKKSKKGNLVPCGRENAGKGTKRAYPACRPTLSACNKKGIRRKKSGETISWK
jgi:hypothetical protein